MNKFVEYIEAAIISGKYAMGASLPSDMELSAEFNLDIQEIRKGITELTHAGLISIIPGIGAVVNDYRKYGSFSLLSSLFNYDKGPLEQRLFNDILELRELIEVQSAKLACHKRTESHIKQLEQITCQERTIHRENIPGIVDLDYNLHHIIALASGNSIYPLLMNTFKKLYTSLSSIFYTVENIVDEVFNFHFDLVESIKQKDETKSVEIMTKIMKHGEEYLHSLLDKK